MRELLPELEAQWVRLGAAIAQRLRPGLSVEQLDAIEAELGFRVPHELRELWAWHDGSEIVGTPDCTIGPGGFHFLTSTQTLQEYRFNREVHPKGQYADEDPEMYWHEGWLPFMVQDAQRVYIDCLRGDPDRDVSPVREVTKTWEDYDVDRATSLAGAISLWTWLLASDYYTWNGRSWDCRWTDIPLFARWMLA
jgi:cell wall assembly regulator SMI1